MAFIRPGLKKSQDFTEDIIDKCGGEIVKEFLIWIMSLGGGATSKQVDSWMNGRNLNGTGETLLGRLQAQNIIVFALCVEDETDSRGNQFYRWFSWEGELSDQGETTRLLVCLNRRDSSWCHWAIREENCVYRKIKKWYNRELNIWYPRNRFKEYEEPPSLGRWDDWFEQSIQRHAMEREILGCGR